MLKTNKLHASFPLFALLSLFLIFFAGCRTLEVPKESSSMWTPPQWYAQSKKPETVLAGVEGRKPSVEKPMKLIELVGLALQNNPSTKQAWYQALSAKARVGEAQSAWYPTATVEQDFDTQHTVSNRPLQSLNQGDIGANMKLTYLLVDFGGRSAKVEQAFQTLLATNFQFNQTFQNLLLNVTSAYFNFFSTTALLEAAHMDVKDAKAALDATNERFSAGIQAKVDVLQATASYQKTLFGLESAKGNLKTAEGDLAKVLGFPAGTPLNIMLPQKDVEFKVGTREVGQLIEEGLAKRPDLAAERASLAAKIAAITAARSDLWPTLNAQGSGSNDWYKYFGRHGLNYDTQHNYGYTAGVSVNWPLFEGFDTVSKIKAAKADADAEFENLRQKELSVTADVWDAYYNFVTATQKLEASKAYLDASQGSYDLSMDGYKTGLKSILDVLNAESDLSDARSQVINSRKELYTSFAQVAYATGTINERTDAARAEKGTIEL
ncbi:MAG: TolC family protein [Candidatus Omnitrophota bacterium]